MAMLNNQRVTFVGVVIPPFGLETFWPATGIPTNKPRRESRKGNPMQFTPAPDCWVRPFISDWLVVWNMAGLWLPMQLGMENHPNWRSLQKTFRGRNQPPTSELSQLVVWPSEDRIFRKFRLVSPKKHHHYIYTEVKAVIDLSQSS